MKSMSPQTCEPSSGEQLGGLYGRGTRSLGLVNALIIVNGSVSWP